MLQKVEPKAKSLNEHRGLSWLAQKVEQGRKAPFSEVVTITPEIAQHILDANYENRNVSQGLIDQIAEDIEHGRWQMNGEAIVLAKNGELNDGQHRLRACIEAKSSIQTIIVFGVARDSRLTVDMGKPRTTGDFMGMQGVKNANNVATIARLYDAYLKDYFYRTAIWQTKQYLLEFYHKHAKRLDAATTRAQNTYARRVVGLPAYGAAFLIIHAANPVEAEIFFQRIQDGANLSRGNAILALRMRLQNVKEQRLQLHEITGLILAHWNAWRKGKQISRSLNVPASWPRVEK